MDNDPYDVRSVVADFAVQRSVFKALHRVLDDEGYAVMPKDASVGRVCEVLASDSVAVGDHVNIFEAKVTAVRSVDWLTGTLELDFSEATVKPFEPVQTQARAQQETGSEPEMDCDGCGGGFAADDLYGKLGNTYCGVCLGTDLIYQMNAQDLTVAFRQQLYDALFPEGRPVEQHSGSARGVVQGGLKKKGKTE